MCKSHKDFMREAIELSIKNVHENGGPFGAVIVKDGEIIAKGVNRVTSNIDPTAHAEVNAIREASAKLGTFNLQGCEIYSSCEPCPMCLGAIYWAHLDKLYFANTKQDARDIDFDDSFIYEELDLPVEKRKIPTTQILREEAIEAFNKWRNKADKTEY
ncbi:nucleoside deaminase [Bacteroidota bacterium]